MRQVAKSTIWRAGWSLVFGLSVMSGLVDRCLAIEADRIEGTAKLDWDGDLARRMVDGIDRFLLDQLERSIEQRQAFWDRSDDVSYAASLTENRQRLAHMLGVRDTRRSFTALDLVATTTAPALVGTGAGYRVYAVRWPVLRHIDGEGLWLVPDQPVGPLVIALPDADQTPEMLVGLMPGIDAESQFARRLAENGCHVLVPTLISRELKPRNGRALLTNREYLYRSAFELGRHVIGYELQKILGAVDWFDQQAKRQRETDEESARIGVFGYGEGGMLALYAGALDPRIDAVVVSGFHTIAKQNASVR